MQQRPSAQRQQRLSNRVLLRKINGQVKLASEPESFRRLRRQDELPNDGLRLRSMTAATLRDSNRPQTPLTIPESAKLELESGDKVRALQWPMIELQTAEK